MNTDTSRNIPQLRRLMDKHFNLDEIRSLCVDLDVDHEDLGGSGKQAVIRELILYMERRGRLGELLSYLQRERPGVA